MASPHNILTLSTLFPNEVSPNFGIFVERQTKELADHEEANVTVVNPIGLPPWPFDRFGQYAALSKLPTMEDWNGLNVHRPRFRLIPKVGGPSNPGRITSAILDAIRAMHSKKPIDVIDAEFFYPDGPAAMRIAEALDIPFTVKARGADIHHWTDNPLCRSQILEAADKASGLLAVSEALKADMIALGMDGSKITVHYTGVDQDKFKPADRTKVKAELDINGPLLITAGALIARKNQNLVIEALAQIPDATLMLAGTGEEERNYRALAVRLGVDDRVRFLGNVPHDDLARLTAAADIAVLVSKSEGLANAWVEALACGTPVVISDVGGARELVRSGTAGRIVERNPTNIAEAAKSILNNPPQQQDVRSTVSDFSWKNNGDQLLGFFQKICGDR